MPLSPKKWSKLECQQLIEKITHRIKVTYAKKLSYAGRLQVITAVLFSIYSFWGAVFILPQSVLKEVDKRCRDYLWGTSEDKRRVPLVSWEKICCPKKNGGLNIKGCSSWNKASVGKLLWQLTHSKNSLCVKWVHDIYIKNDPNVWSHTVPQDFSWYWKKLNSLKEKMQEWYVQGKYILTPKGDYSITSSYNALLGGQVKMENASLVWSKFAQPKHRFIAWLATKKRLLTKERLGQMRIIVIDMDCCLCDDQEIETSQHLFGEPKLVFDVIRRKHWQKLKKEVMAAIWGATIYHIWTAMNKKLFQNRNVQVDTIVTQIKKEIKERIGMIKLSNRGSRSRGFIQRLLCNKRYAVPVFLWKLGAL
ncbi:uncharacterized protein LOC142171846 [Nicotiana tabacum]|uniref:Uncharacterized protein LOC142171846 n=1 Tax=Nicotiana tabacum TaxID=4097 RepID=A0AC58T342_TOBAC